VIVQSNFLGTAALRSVLVTDAVGNPVGSFTFTSDSGVLLHPVPEPSAWAMMISGIVALGFAARRRRAV